MADPNKDSDKFVEIEGVKYKEDPENEGQAVLGEDGKLVLYEEEKAEEKETPKETEEEKITREKKETEEEENREPSTRKSAASHIIDRKNRKIEKLKKKKEDDKGGDDDDGGGDDGEEALTPEGQKAIDKAIDRAIKPVLQTVRTNADEQELANVIAKYPMAKEMEKQIRKYMDHEAYRDVSVEFIFLGLANKKMDLRKKKDKADEDAMGDVLGGHGRRVTPTGPIPDVRGWSDNQIGELVQKIQAGQE